MGDPRKQRKKYKTPSILWNKQEIEEGSEILKTYGLKNKKEMWKMGSKLRKFASDAKKLIPLRTKQAEIERKQLLQKVISYGLLPGTAKLDDILGLTIKDLLERRLQTMIFRQGFARSVTQARQFITHQHVTVAGNKITSPSYIVNVSEEKQISFYPYSTLASVDHPERAVVEKGSEVEAEKPKKQKKKGDKGKADKDSGKDTKGKKDSKDKKKGDKKDEKAPVKEDTKDEKPAEEKAESKEAKDETSR